MPLYNITTNTDGVDATLVAVATQVPEFIYSLLFFVFMFVFLTGSGLQAVRKGFSDLPLWSTMASLSTLLVALILSIKEGVINIEVLLIILSVTIFSGLWLFLSKLRGDN
jgi:uncharacterized membrane protein YhdT